MNKTACILYGFAEGKRHGAHMHDALEKRGYEVVTSAENAELIIAHSGGFLAIYNLKDSQTLLLIDLAYWPTRKPVSCFLRHVWYDIVHVALQPRSTSYWVWKTAWNLWYMIVQLPRQMMLYRVYWEVDLRQLVSRERTVLTQSADISWYDPSEFPSSVKNNIHFVSADHDDCWRHPDRYLDLLEPTS